MKNHSQNRLTTLGLLTPADPIITHVRVKGEHTYMFRFPLSQAREGIRAVGRMAADPQIDFDWYDAALVSKEIREFCDGVNGALNGGGGGDDGDFGYDIPGIGKIEF